MNTTTQLGKIITDTPTPTLPLAYARGISPCTSEGIIYYSVCISVILEILSEGQDYVYFTYCDIYVSDTF